MKKGISAPIEEANLINSSLVAKLKTSFKKFITEAAFPLPPPSPAPVGIFFFY